MAVRVSPLGDRLPSIVSLWQQLQRSGKLAVGSLNKANAFSDCLRSLFKAFLFQCFDDLNVPLQVLLIVINPVP